MAQATVYIASHDAEEYRRLLEQSLGKSVVSGLGTTAEEVVENYGGEPVLLGSPDLLSTLLAGEPPIAWAQSTWAGVTPLIELPFRNYQLTVVKEVFGAQMGEYVLGYLLAHELRMSERRQFQAGKQWQQSPSARLAGKTMGIMGTGSIGRHVASMGAELGLRLLGFSNSGHAVPPFERVYAADSLAAFLPRCDYVVGILPHLPATTDLLGKAAFGLMKNSAILINVGRGNLVDEESLCAALRDGEIAAAILDVFKQEPLPPQSPLWTAPNCTITAHVAAISHPQDIAGLFVENYRRFCAGKTLRHLVDFDKGY